MLETPAMLEQALSPVTTAWSQPLPMVLAAVWAGREDLQRAFPPQDPDGGERLLYWLFTEAPKHSLLSYAASDWGRMALPGPGGGPSLPLLLHVWGLPRSTVYWRRQQPKGPGRRRGPQGFYSDAALVGQIKAEIASRPFPGEGYRKIWAGLRGKGIRTSPTRTLRLMREHNWLAPTRVGHPHGPKAHDGTIKTSRVDEMWGTDMPQAQSRI